MPLYHINLPRTIPRSIFERLNGDVHDGIVRRIDDGYSDVTKDTYSEASTPLEALSNLFVRQLGNGINARSLIKMFRPDADKYAVLEPVQAYEPLPAQQAQPNLEQRAEPEQGQLNLF